MWNYDDDVSAVERQISAAVFWRILPTRKKSVRPSNCDEYFYRGRRRVSFKNQRMFELPATWGKADFRKVCGKMFLD